MINFELPFAGNFPITNPFSRSHLGIDYGTPRGTPIESSAPGIVDRTYWNQGGGNVAEIRHGVSGIETEYAHLDRILVKAGQRVGSNTVIGFSGNTGEATTGPHLMFSARQDGKAINPLELFGTGGLTGNPFEDEFSSGNDSDEGLFGIPGAIGDAALTFGFIFLGAMVLIAGVLIMRTN